MKRTNKIICLAVLMIAMFGVTLAGNFLVYPTSVDSVIVKPDGRYVVAAAATSDAIGSTANNISNCNGLGAAAYVYAGAYEQYVLFLNTSDADGFDHILNITAEFVSSDGATNYGGFFCDTTTATVTVTEIQTLALEDNVRLSAGSANVSAGTVVDVSIPFYFEWDIGAVTDMDINVTVMEAAASEELQKDANIDVIATLTHSDAVLFPHAEYLNGIAFGGMELTYHYTGYAAIYPLAAETDFWVSMAAIPAEQVSARAWDSTGYAEGTGIAQFDDIMAPDVNTEQTVTFTLYAVDKAGGSADTSLMTADGTDTALIGPNAPIHTDDGDDGWVIPNIFDSAEGVLLVGGIVVVMGVGVYYVYGRKASAKARPRSKRRKPAKKKPRKRRRKK